MATAAEVAELVDRFTPLALAIARRFARSFPWLDCCLASDASYALWRAAQRHDPDRGPFAPYARMRVRWACLRVLARERRANPQAFAPQPDEDLEHPAGQLVGREPGPDQAAAVESILALLSEREREIVERRVFNGELFSEMGPHKGKLCETYWRAIAKLRRLVRA